MSQSKSDNARVRVIVRVRPLNRSENEREVKEIIRPPLQGFERSLCIYDPAALISGLKTELIESWNRTFSFDKCLWSNNAPIANYAKQEDLFMEVGEPVLDWILSGFNCCVFAFGQTGSGKTYSMMGNMEGETEHYGLVPRICFSLFASIAEIELEKSNNVETHVTFSHMEIYNESVHDLLTPPRDVKRPVGLRIREHPQKGMFIPDLTIVRVTSFEEVVSLIAIGDKNRTVAATNVNMHSSRSHAIVTLTVIMRERAHLKDGLPTSGLQKKEGRVHLVDLAGSERVVLSGAKKTRLKEACSINKSLSVLGDVILSLSSTSKKKHIPYRNSALTMVLKDSLGGNAHAIMIATVSPSSFDYEESLSTLKYADRAKKVRMRVDANVTTGLLATDSSAHTLVPLLQAEVKKLKEMLEQQQKDHQELLEYQNQQSQLNASTASMNDSVSMDYSSATTSGISPATSTPSSMSAEQMMLTKMMVRVQELEKQLADRETLIGSLQLQGIPVDSSFSTINSNSQNSHKELSINSTKGAQTSDSGTSTEEPTTIGATTTTTTTTTSESGSPSSEQRSRIRVSNTNAVLADDAKDHQTPRLINLNQDPLFSECLIYYLPLDTKISAGSAEGCYVPLSAPDVLTQHCELKLERNTQEVSLLVHPNALVFLNGEIVTGKQTLSNLDRLAFGRFHLFRFERKNMGLNNADNPMSSLIPSWEYAQEELMRKNEYLSTLNLSHLKNASDASVVIDSAYSNSGKSNNSGSSAKSTSNGVPVSTYSSPRTTTLTSPVTSPTPSAKDNNRDDDLLSKELNSLELRLDRELAVTGGQHTPSATTDEKQGDKDKTPTHAEINDSMWSKINAVAQGSIRADAGELREMLKAVVSRADKTRINKNLADSPTLVPWSPENKDGSTPNNKNSSLKHDKGSSEVRKTVSAVPIESPKGTGSNFEKEALSLQQDLIQMQLALQDRMKRYKEVQDNL